jgi:hypothetical protein
MRDERFAILTAPVRQRVLLTLLRCRPSELPLSVPDDLDGDGVDVDFHTRLYHVHLPKLTSAGYVTWDIVASTVTRGPRFGEIEPVLDALGT